jgi:hypothetical protein
MAADQPLSPAKSYAVHRVTESFPNRNDVTKEGGPDTKRLKGGGKELQLSGIKRLREIIDKQSAK